MAKDFLRSFYLAAGMVVATFIAAGASSNQYTFTMAYEDHIDWALFEQVKQGRSVDQLARAAYYSDGYSAEGRSS